MFKNFFLLVASIFVFNCTLTYSEVTEIQTIEEYSKQFLDELDNTEQNVQKSDDGKKLNPTDEAVIDNSKYFEEDLEIEVPDKEKVIFDNEAEKQKNNHKVDWILDNNFRAALIGDTKGNIIFSRNANKFYPLASITKVMTLMVTFDEIRAGRVSMKDKVTISKEIARIGGSALRMKAGQVFVLEDLIKASAIYSANNATYAIAKHVGRGDISKFVAKMNAKVKALGLEKDLKYYTPAGLPTRMTKKPMDSGTAKGIYKLSIEALKYKKYIEIAGMKKANIHNNKITIKNRNHLIGEKGVYGIKTGYHKEAKYNITIASKINGTNMIVVVLGGDSYKKRDNTVLDILDIFENNYEKRQILDKNKVIGTIKVPNTVINLRVKTDKSFSKIIEKGKELYITLEARPSLKLSIFKGEEVGTYEVYDGDDVIFKGKLISSENIK